MLKSLVFRAFITVTGYLPLRLLRWLGHLLGTILWVSRSRMWLVTESNIGLCYPGLDEHRQKLLARESLRETGKTITETTFAWTRRVPKVLNLIDDIEGIDAVQTAQSAGNGLVFVIPHLGNWEVINHYLGTEYGLTHMYQPNRNPGLNDYIQTQRRRTGTQFVKTDLSGIKAQLKVIKSGGAIGIMPDQEPLIHTGEFAPFFGIDALTNELIAGFTQPNTRLFTAVCERTETGFKLVFEPLVFETDDTKFDKLCKTNLSIENAIRRKPAQYLWSYKRFRTRPAGELDFYSFDGHPIRTSAESFALQLYLSLGQLIPPRLVRTLSVLIGYLPGILKKRKKITRINLTRCFSATALFRASVTSLVESAMEAPRIWRGRWRNFQNRVQIRDHLPRSDRGTIVLTPPLGSREALMRWLGVETSVTEYYHPNSVTSLDRLIRYVRAACGVKLVEHDEPGRRKLTSHLQNGHTVTLCPDQQPRLRGGLFVPFFGLPALTTKTLPTLLKETGADLVIGVAWRDGHLFNLEFRPIDYDRDANDEALLLQVNEQLEALILEQPGQYRWSDKRFNIQPLGQPKIYR